MTPKQLDRFGCMGNTIKVADGGYVDLANPDPATIDIRTIAAALSKMCRFGCHCPRFYSVAEHCLHATAQAAKDGYGGEVLVAVMLHDAAEAYIGDIVKPLKVMLPDYQAVESRMEAAVAERFGINGRFDDIVKRYDRIMLKAEKLALWPDDRETWAGFAETEDRHPKFQFWGPDDAERHFLRNCLAIGLTDTKSA